MRASNGLLSIYIRFRATLVVLLIFLGFLVFCCVPLIAKDTISNEIFSHYNNDAPIIIEYVGELVVYEDLSLDFVGILGAMVLINLVFFIIDEALNDSVTGRRILQIVLNITIITIGIVLLLYYTLGYLPHKDWWSYIQFSPIAEISIKYGPAIVFAVCGTLQMIWDVFFFCGLNRNPIYHHRNAKMT